MVDLESVKASLADYKVCKLHYHLKFGVSEIIFFFFYWNKVICLLIKDALDVS